jgi:uncharacterized coiled-coil DUF342 family protein
MDDMQKIKVIVKRADEDHIIHRLNKVTSKIETVVNKHNGLVDAFDNLCRRHNELCDDFDDLCKKHNLLDIAWGVSTLGLTLGCFYLYDKYQTLKSEYRNLTNDVARVSKSRLEHINDIDSLNSEILELRTRISHLEMEDSNEE